MKVLHVITGLTLAGAEQMLYKLAVRQRRAGLRTLVACLGPAGDIARRLADAGVEVHFIGLTRNPLTLFRFARLVRLIRRTSPDVIHAWLYQADIAAAAARALAGSRARLFWSVHQSLYTLRYESPLHAALILLAARLSRIPERIVYVSRASAEQHARRGFAPDKARLIPIGFDLEAFRPLAFEEKARARAARALDPAALCVGLLARNNPKKDPGNFIDAAARLAARFPNARFMMAGRGMDTDPALRARARAQDLEKVFDFEGERRDAARWIGSLDVLVSASYTEAFPNVIGEAMACGVPCVVTDVGDSALLVGDAGYVVPPRDPEALARALEEILALPPEERAQLGARGRARIEARFSMEEIARRYDALYAGEDEEGGPATRPVS